MGIIAMLLALLPFGRSDGEPVVTADPRHEPKHKITCDGTALGRYHAREASRYYRTPDGFLLTHPEP